MEGLDVLTTSSLTLVQAVASNGSEAVSSPEESESLSSCTLEHEFSTELRIIPTCPVIEERECAGPEELLRLKSFSRALSDLTAEANIVPKVIDASCRAWGLPSLYQTEIFMKRVYAGSQ